MIKRNKMININDLEPGKHVVECKNGERYLYIGDGTFLGKKGDLDGLNEDLTCDVGMFTVTTVLSALEQLDNGYGAVLNVSHKVLWDREECRILAHTEDVRLSAYNLNMTVHKHIDSMSLEDLESCCAILTELLYTTTGVDANE